MNHFPLGFEEMGWSAEDCEQMQQAVGGDEFLRAMFQQGIALGNKSVVEAVLDAGVPVDAPWFGHGATALFSAGHIGTEMTRLLLERGASPNVEDGDGATPLRNAILSRNVAVVQLLLGYGADPWHRIPWDNLRETTDDVATEMIVQLLLYLSAEGEGSE